MPSKRKPTADLTALIAAWRERHGIPTLAGAARRLQIPYRTLQDWHLANRTPRGFALRSLIERLKR